MSPDPATRPPARSRPIHVGFGIDSAYAPHAAVAAASVFQAHPRDEVHVHVAFTELEDSIVQRFEGVATGSLHHIHFRRVSGQGLPGFARFSDAVHLRFALPELVPAGCERLLYLDADVVVASPLTPLFEVDLEGATLGAVVDETWPGQIERLEDRSLSRYVNIGVLLIDVRRWRERDTGARLRRFILAEGPSLMMPDQDAVNIVLEEEIHLLDRRWNVQRPTFFEASRELDVTVGERRDLVSRPGIVHFTDWSKPWDARDQHPLGGLYRELRAGTPFRDPTIDASRGTGTRVKSWIRRLLVRVHPDAGPFVEGVVGRLKGSGDLRDDS